MFYLPLNNFTFFFFFFFILAVHAWELAFSDISSQLLGGKERGIKVGKYTDEEVEKLWQIPDYALRLALSI